MANNPGVSAGGGAQFPPPTASHFISPDQTLVPLFELDFQLKSLEVIKHRKS